MTGWGSPGVAGGCVMEVRILFWERARPLGRPVCECWVSGGVGISWAGAHGKNGEFSVVAEGSRCCQAEEAWVCVPASA